MATERVYTTLDPEIVAALELAGEAGLVEKGASRSERLHALATYAQRRLIDARAAEERAAAYDEIAADEERAAEIDASVLAAVEDGLL